MYNLANTIWKGGDAHVVESYDATDLLYAPFTVLLKNSVKQVIDEDGEVVETIIPDPNGLVKAVAQMRALHSQKLSGIDLKFLRSALGMKSKTLAKKISITPEHMSRLESGEKVLSPQSEMLVRIYTFISTVRFTPKKEADATKFAELVGNVFSGLDIMSCYPANAELVLTLIRVPSLKQTGNFDSDESGLWNEDDSVAV